MARVSKNSKKKTNSTFLMQSVDNSDNMKLYCFFLLANVRDPPPLLPNVPSKFKKNLCLI